MAILVSRMEKTASRKYEREYALAAELCGAVVREGPSARNVRIRFLCNPNNPDGALLPRDHCLSSLEEVRAGGGNLFLDEAFIELSDPGQSVAHLAADLEFLFVMRSLTKSFGVPGLRLGFGATNPLLAEIMNRARIPWSIGSIAAAAGEHLLTCQDHLERSRFLVQEELAWLTSALQGLGLEPLPSRVNFILVNIGPTGLASDILAERTMARGILVRDCQSFSLGKDYIRVAVRNRSENEQLVAALELALSCKD
jgi:threonine-phosphate decarboxylase